MAKKIVQLVENTQGRSILETKPRYKILVNGVECGELYWNMTGYNGYLPQAHGVVLDVGEGAISRYKKELVRINREWAAAGEIAYYKIDLHRTTPNDDSQTAQEIADMRNTEYAVCKPFPALATENDVRNAVASGTFREYVVGEAMKAGRIEPREKRLVTGVVKMPEADYWRKRLVQH